jgi:mediator of replication checkpoint protein 1
VDYDEDDPFRTSALPRAPKETGANRDADSDSGSDVEMPGISEILAQKEACESQRAQKERLQQLKLTAIAQQQQKRASTSAGSSPGAEQDSDDDGLDVVPDTMHSVAREEAAARAAAGHIRPSAGRTRQLRFAHVAASPQRSDAHSIIPATDQSPEKLIVAAAQSTFISSLARGGGAAAGRGKRNVGMTKADLERMVLRSAEAQSEQLRREKEEEWVRRGGRVVGVMEVVGGEKIQELIGEALEHSGDTPAQGDGGGDAGSDDDDDDADYVPIERGSASPQQEQDEEEEVQVPTEETSANMDERREDDDVGIAEAMALAETEVDSETESGAPNNVRLRRRTARPRHTIIGSDDEDGPPAVDHTSPEIRPPPLSLPDLPSPAFTSTASSRPSGNTEHPDHDHDHENDPDVSGNDTDKENRAVVRRGVSGPAPTHGARILFDDILSARVGMGTALQPSVLPADDDPFAFMPSSDKTREQAMRRLGSPAPKPFAGKRGLSQMFEEEEGDGLGSIPALMIQGVDGEPTTPGEMDADLVGLKPVLGGLSQAFEETQVIHMLSPELYMYILALTTHTLHVQDASGSGLGGLTALRRGADAELSLTFEAQAAALQPALEVDDRLRARAAAIFEKEQEYVLEAAQPAPSRARRELYITDNGCAFALIFLH